MHYHEGSDEKLTVIVKVERPFGSGRPLTFKFGILLVHVPANIVENLVVLLFTEGVYARYLLNLPRLEYTDEHLQTGSVARRLLGDRKGCNTAGSGTGRAAAASLPSY